MSKVLTLAAGAAFLAMLDATVTNLAVADLGHDFGSPIADLSWVVSAYFIAFAALLTPAGRLAGVLGLRRLYVAGVGLFTLMSAVCAVAPSLGILIGARALQGAGAAAMIPASLAILLVAVPAERRTGAIGLWSAAAALAAAAGPALGGILVDVFGWRSVFVINLPLGLALVAAARSLPVTATGARRPDLLGTALLVGGIAAVVLGLTEGTQWGWGAPATLGALAAGSVATLVALVRSGRVPVPAIEVGLWRSRTFAIANVASLLYGLALYPWMLLGVLVLTDVWGYSPLEAGLAMSPAAVIAALSAVTAGRLSARVGTRAIVVVGGAVLFAAALWIALVLPQESNFLGLWLPGGVLIGIGTGALTTGTSTAAALSVAPARFADATGLNTTARQLGGALGIAALAVLLGGRGQIAHLDDYTHVYLFCALASAGAGLAGLALTRPARAPLLGARELQSEGSH
jgi:EmrB/QacA subfamily drug resistance transporter